MATRPPVAAWRPACAGHGVASRSWMPRTPVGAARCGSTTSRSRRLDLRAVRHDARGMTEALTPRPVRLSRVEMTEIVLPGHTNALGTIFGGQLMAWIDIAGSIASARHARGVCVTASIDALQFVAPVRIGQHVC